MTSRILSGTAILVALVGLVTACSDDAKGDSKARISGFHDESGGAATNAEIAKQRAQAVKQWLQEQGIASERIEMDKPAVTEGGGDASEARRVEVSVE